MERSVHTPIEELAVFRRYVEVANWAWEQVHRWPSLAQSTVGTQLIRCCDSVGANLVEGDGRGSDRDSVRFFVIARASAREARYWITRSVERGLIAADEGQVQVSRLVGATQLLNRLIQYRRSSLGSDRVSEPAPPQYDADPFSERTLTDAELPI